MPQHLGVLCHGITGGEGCLGGRVAINILGGVAVGLAADSVVLWQWR